MVAEYDKWIFDAARKEGDTDIVKTDYGYHVMYFIGSHDSYSDVKIRGDKATEDVNKLTDEILDSDAYVIGMGPRRTSYLEEKMLDRIAVTIARNNQSSTAQY